MLYNGIKMIKMRSYVNLIAVGATKAGKKFNI